MIFGSCAPELKRVAIKVLSQTTSATNCERNWSTFSYIHTKTRNRLKYKKLQKLVFTYYNMKLKMRHEMRRSQEEIEVSFNPINLDYIFQEDDPLSQWIEEREGPLLDGLQNAEWLPMIDTDDEDMETGDDHVSSEENSGGLSPPSDNSGNGGGNVEAEENDDEDEQTQDDPYQEMPYNRRDQSLLIDMTTSRPDMVPSSDSVGDSRRGGSQSRRGKKKQNVALGDSSSSNIAQSFSDFSIDETSQSSQGYYPPSYHHPYYGTHDQFTSGQAPPYYQPSMDYQYPYHQQSSGGFFDYVFGQGATQGDSQNESGGYDLPRHSTMW